MGRKRDMNKVDDNMQHKTRQNAYYMMEIMAI